MNLALFATMIQFLNVTAGDSERTATPSADQHSTENPTPQLPPDPSGKLYQKFEMQRGFYISSDVGVMLVFNGAASVTSTAEPYIGLNIGYDFNRWLSWQIHAGRGFAASAARTSNEDARIRDFSFTNVMSGPIVWLRVWERLAIELKAQAGISIFDPVPVESSQDSVSNLALSVVQPIVGGGIALKYLTLLTDFTLGLEVTFNYIIPTAIPMIAISPTVRYTF